MVFKEAKPAFRIAMTGNVEPNECVEITVDVGEIGGATVLDGLKFLGQSPHTPLGSLAHVLTQRAPVSIPVSVESIVRGLAKLHERPTKPHHLSKTCIDGLKIR